VAGVSALTAAPTAVVSLLLQVCPTFLASLLLLVFMLLPMGYLLWPVIPILLLASLLFLTTLLLMVFHAPCLASLLLFVSSDFLSVSCAAVGHAVAGFITAILSPMGSLLAGVSAVSAVHTAAGWKWFLRFPMSGVAVADVVGLPVVIGSLPCCWRPWC